MTPCPKHKAVIHPSSPEAVSWMTTFHKKHGHYPLPCEKCGYLDLDPTVYEKKKLLDLKGSIKGTELEKLLVTK